MHPFDLLFCCKTELSRAIYASISFFCFKVNLRLANFSIHDIHCLI